MSTPIVSAGANASIPQPAPVAAPQAPVEAPKELDAAAAPVTPPVEPAKKEDPFSQRFAALSRQEKVLRQRETEWKAKQDAHQAEWNPKIQEYQKFAEQKAKAKTDPTVALGLLQELGLTYEELSKLVINDNKPTAEMIAERARRETESLREEFTKRDEQAKEAQTKAQADKEAQAIQSVKGEITTLLSAKPDEFEFTLNHPEGVDLVFSVMEQHFTETQAKEGTGRVLTYEEAASHVEKWLEKEIEDKVLSRKKIQGRLNPVTGDPTKEGANPAGAGGNQPSAESPRVVQASSRPVTTRTLTNADQTSAPTNTKAVPRTREESIAEAARLLKWKT